MAIAAPSARIRKPVKTVFCADETGATTCYQYNWEERGIPDETTERPNSGARSGEKADWIGIKRSPGDYRAGSAHAGTHPDPRGSGRAGESNPGARSNVDSDGASAAHERSGRPPGPVFP